MKIQIYPQGTRVRVRKGALPQDSALLERTGLVIHALAGSGHRYGVQLDGESQIRVFMEEELEACRTDSPANTAST